MLDNKTRTEILLEEKIAKIDDINFDKIYDVDEFATKQLETFEDAKTSSVELSTKRIAEVDEEQTEEIETSKDNTAFELELQPNEFLDNMVWGEDEEIEEINKKHKYKFSLVNKPLFATFTSIALLLCILFIYNAFIIRSLERSIANASTSQNGDSNVSTIVEENNNITFENSSILEIEHNTNYISTTNNKSTNTQTNWFNEICSYLNRLFGGSY